MTLEETPSLQARGRTAVAGVHYRGTLNGSEAIDTAQDRLFELVVELGGRAEHWSTRGPLGRAVRGLFVELKPGCDVAGFLFSAEGRLVPPLEIEAAERAPLPAETWLFVKTASGPAHAVLLKLLRFLKTTFMRDLEVLDDVGDWKSGETPGLRRRKIGPPPGGRIEAFW